MGKTKRHVIDNRVPLQETKRYELHIKSKNGGETTISDLRVIGRGGSCLVYEGKTPSLLPGAKNRYVIVKEFYPIDEKIKRQDDMQLAINNGESFEDRKKVILKD